MVPIEYVYATLLLYKAGKEINEENLKRVLEAAGVEVDEVRVKSIVAAIKNIDIAKVLEQAIAAPVATVSAAPASPPAATEEKKEEKKEEESKELSEEALAEDLQLSSAELKTALVLNDIIAWKLEFKHLSTNTYHRSFLVDSEKDKIQPASENTTNEVEQLY